MSNFEDKDSRNNGRWTKMEHEKFLLGVQLYGKNWKKIQQLVGTRTGAQIRSHAQKFFLKSKCPNNQQFPEQAPQESHQLQRTLSVNSKQFTEYQEINNIQFQKQIQQENQIESFIQNQYSYFLRNIIKLTMKNKVNQRFDFWELFIDNKLASSQTLSKDQPKQEQQIRNQYRNETSQVQQQRQRQGEQECTQQYKRKDSFVAFDGCNDYKQDTTLSGLSMLGQPII